MKFIGIIPARYESTRFPGKPLVMIDGMMMIERVYKQAIQSKSLSKVIIATDDDRIKNAAESFGAQVMMTSTFHQSGTDRCAEVIEKIKEEFDVAINIQGDEPFIDPRQLDELTSCFNKQDVEIATLIKKINDVSEINNPNVVKVVRADNGYALYFSRSAIPYSKNTAEEEQAGKNDYYKHIGVYAYRCVTLKMLTHLPQNSLELAESLEQLRWLQNGYRIMTAVTTFENVAIDTPEDLEKIKRIIKNRTK